MRRRSYRRRRRRPLPTSRSSTVTSDDADVMPGPITEIVDQHAEEAAFLWALRAQAVHAPHYLLSDLAHLDARIEAHLDGLRANGEAAWATISAAAAEDPGAVFAAGVLAIESGDARRVHGVVEFALATSPAARALVSALGWCSYERVKPLVQQLAASDEPARARVGIGAAAAQRENPGPTLGRALGAADPALASRAWRAAGELGVGAARAAMAARLAATDPALRYSAAWASAITTAEPAAVKALQAIAEGGAAFAEDAAALAVRRL